MNAKLTAKETALMTAIAENHFSFFDQGLVHGSGIWTDCMTDEIAGNKKYEVSSTRRGAATVIASLGRKGLLITVDSGDEDGAWTDLSPEGQAWVESYNGTTTAEAPAEVVETTAPVEPAADVTVVKEGDTEIATYTTEANGTTTEWTEVTFADASRTIKRRKQVSGQWRTDYWGAEFAGDAEHYTTAAKVKAARAAGTFTR